MRIAVVNEMTGLPDEGIKNWTRQLVAALQEAGHEAELHRLEGHFRFAALDPRAGLRLRRAAPDVIQYVPYSHLTRNALIRLKALSAFAPRALASIAVLQAPVPDGRYPGVLRAPHAVFITSRLATGHASAARTHAVLPPAVPARFAPSPRPREELRGELGVPPGRPLVLHVGHLLHTRNLRALARLARTGAYEVVVIASTTFEPDPGLADELRAAGVTVHHRYVPDLEQWYQAADVYVFPVLEPLGSIDLPLTVLEALACGAPVVTTRFGGLEEFVPASEQVRYADPDELEREVERSLAAAPPPAAAPVDLSPARLGLAAAKAYERALAR